MLLDRQGAWESLSCIMIYLTPFFVGQIKLPSDYSFGISAASAELADSFEVFKFVLTTSSPTIREEPRRDEPAKSSSQNSYRAPEDSKASTITSQESQFADLHDRLQAMAHVLDATFEEIVRLSHLAEGRHQEIVRNFVPKEKINSMEQKIQSIDSAVQGYQQQFLSLQKLVRESHSRLTVGLPQHMSESMFSHLFLPFLPPRKIPSRFADQNANSNFNKVSSHGLPPLHFHILSASPCSLIRCV